jgi:hypothetical protein
VSSFPGSQLSVLGEEGGQAISKADQAIARKARIEKFYPFAIKASRLGSIKPTQQWRQDEVYPFLGSQHFLQNVC